LSKATELPERSPTATAERAMDVSPIEDPAERGLAEEIGAEALEAEAPLRPPPSRRRWWILATVLAALALLYALGHRGEEAAPPGPGGGPGLAGAFGQGPVVVTTAGARQGAVAIEAEFVGTLEAEAFAELFARTSGQLVEVRADTGERVRRGQTLARIDDAEEREGLEQTRAALRMAEATVAQRQADLELARATAERTRSLLEERLVSEQVSDQAQAQLAAAEAQLALARAQVEQARANLATTEVELANTRIIAPFDGFIGQRLLDGGAFAATNRPVFTIVDLSTIETEIHLTERDAARVAVGQPASVRVAAFPERRFEGRVARIANIFDPQTHTTTAEVEVENPGALLKPGMFATVAIVYRTEPDALLVPESALVEGERETAVFRLQAGEPAVDPGGGGAARPGGGGPAPGDRSGGGAGRSGPAAGAAGFVAERVPVTKIGAGTGEDRDWVAVEGALRPGDRVITLAPEGLRAGMPVVPGDRAGGTGETGAAPATPRPPASAERRQDS
jgi:RND family efflux transporter MFP subunit